MHHTLWGNFPMKLVFLLLALTLSTATLAAENNAAVLKRIQSLAPMLSDGVATLYEEGMLVRKASFGKEGNAYVVLFSMEGFGGGNGARQYLAVFEQNSKEGWPDEWEFNELSLAGIIKVGEDFDRRFDSISITGNLITLRGKRWNNDAHCCPSAPASATFRFERRSLSEVAPSR